jgi:hypothetical protein
MAHLQFPGANWFQLALAAPVVSFADHGSTAAPFPAWRAATPT